MLLQYHSIINNAVEKALSRHSARQRTKGKRFPYRYSSKWFVVEDEKKEEEEEEEYDHHGGGSGSGGSSSSNGGMMSDVDIVTMLTQSPYGEVRNEAMQPLTLCMASVCVGYGNQGGMQEFLRLSVPCDMKMLHLNTTCDAAVQSV